jgi:response regulator NasT
MNRSLRIALADDDAAARDYLLAVLPLLGHDVVAAARDGDALVAACRAEAPDLVIADVHMPGLGGIEASRRVYEESPLPVILASARPDASTLDRADHDHVLAFLVKPIRQADLEPAIVVAVSRFEQLQALRRETADLRQALEDRKLIERAKSALMRRTGLPEHDAFRRLQRLASDRNRKLADVARMILTAEDAYRVDA